MITNAPGSSPLDPIALKGELTIYTAAETVHRLLGDLQGRCACDLDLRGVTELDGAGIQLLLWLKQEQERRGCTLRVVACSDAVTEVLQLLRLGPALAITAVAAATEGGS